MKGEIMKKDLSNLKYISFRWKLLFLIIATTIVPLTLMIVIFLNISEQAIIKQSTEMTNRSLTTTISRIDFALRRTLELSDMLPLNSEFTEIVNETRIFTSDEKAEKYQVLRTVANQYITAVESTIGLTGVDSCYIYLPSLNAVVDSSATYYENPKIENIDFIQQNNRGDFDGKWILSNAVDYYSLNNIKNNSNKNISYLRQITNEQDITKAMLLINIRGSFISDYYDKVQLGIPSELIILDDQGNLISHDIYNLLDKETYDYSELYERIKNSRNSNNLFIEQDGKEKFVVFAKSDYTKWTYLLVVPKVLVLTQVYEIRNYLKVIIFIMLPITIILTYFISWFFYRPLNELVAAMKQIKKQNLSVRITEHRSDEYQQVFDGFNHMLDEIEVLIKNLTDEKILNKEAQILLLQAQINPHFLYNTLESIHSIAKITKVDEISIMVSALSKFFRLSLSEGKNEILLKESIDLVVNYLTIQNIRFKGKVDYFIDIPEQIMNLKVPKFLLQPIVENSIYHGIEKKSGTGHLRILGKIVENEIIIEILDDGVGILPERLAIIRDSLDNSNLDDEGFYALKNINKQLKLKYGKKYGIRIESEYYHWTKVILCIPLIQYGGEERV